MIRYLDASAIMRYVLRSPHFIDLIAENYSYHSSRLSRLECRRTLHRLRLESLIDDEQLSKFAVTLDKIYTKISMIDMNEYVLASAETNWGVILGSLDSIHLATAAAIREHEGTETIVYTHDKALATAAKIQGFEVVG